MDEPNDSLNEMMAKPRIGFLVAAAFSALLAVGAYIFEDEIIGPAGEDSVTYALLLVVLVLVTMALLVCYRVPSLGNRVLGYHRLNANPKMAAKSDVQYSAGFKSDTGVDTKRVNSRRKQTRHSRKHYAAVTREMQQQAKNKPADADQTE